MLNTMKKVSVSEIPQRCYASGHMEQGHILINLMEKGLLVEAREIHIFSNLIR